MPHGLALSDFQAVLFDVDGTLVNSLETIVLGLGDTYERFAGIRPTEVEILNQIGKPLHHQFQLYDCESRSTAPLEELVAYAVSRFEAHEDREAPFDAAVETLRFVHERGLRTALVTSKTAVELDAFMRRFSGAPYVDATVCATDVERPKPDPQSAMRACALLGVEPERVVMVGDSIFDLRCARDAGVACVAVAYGAGRRDALLAEHPDLLFDTPEELFAWAESAFLEKSCRERS